MRKFNLTLALFICLILLATFSFEFLREGSNRWTKYTSDNLGISIEYPAGKLPIVQEEQGRRIEYNITKGKKDFLRLGTVIFKKIEEGPADLSITADRFAFSSTQEWINWLKDFYGNTANIVVDGQVIIAGLQGFIFQVAEPGSKDDPGNQNIAFLRDGTVYRISARGISGNDFRHVWKSFSFSTK